MRGDKKKNMHRDTEIVHAGYRKKTEPGVFLPGPQFSSTYTTPGDPSQHPLSYGRFHNPTWTAWEEALAVLEGGGHVVTFGSGMAAINALFGVVLKPGDVVVLPADSYYAVRRLASGWLESIGIRVRRWITLHGIAINVDPDLSHFAGIVPCGVSERRYGVTSLADLGITATMPDLDLALRREFEALFGPVKSP